MKITLVLAVAFCGITAVALDAAPDDDSHPLHSKKEGPTKFISIQNVGTELKATMDKDALDLLTGMLEKCKSVLDENGCTGFESMGTERPKNVKPPGGAQNSCHYYDPAKAIDIGAFQCGGVEVKPESGGSMASKYAAIAKCFATEQPEPNPNNGPRIPAKPNVLYGFPVAPEEKGRFHVEPKHHKNHIHFEVAGCKANSPGFGGK